MVWLLIAALALLALLPLGFVLRRGQKARGERELALLLHRTQLTELDRDLAENRIGTAEHDTARLEIQRRILAAADRAEGAARPGSRGPVVLTLLLVPMGALVLYLWNGQPFMPSIPPAIQAARQARALEEARLVDQLRTRLSTLDPATDQARSGYVLLGNVEEARGNAAAAAEAFRAALRGRFDPLIAVRAADASMRAEGGLSNEAAGLLKRALAEAPPDAPWRGAVQEQLRAAGR